MGMLGKVILGAVVGVGAVAAAPFTGGGSLLAGASLATSLAGAGVAAGVGAGVGAIAGGVAGSIEEDEQMEEIKKAKESAYEDGVREGMYKTSDEVKKYVDFFLATTALSYYAARCDGEISEEEQWEIQQDMDAIKKNCEMPDQIKTKLEEIENDEILTWYEVKEYLDKVGLDTLRRLQKDVEEIVEADGIIRDEEKEVMQEFADYLEFREENNNFNDNIDYKDGAYLETLSALTVGAGAVAASLASFSWLNDL